MRILYIDIDSLRPDHLGCYGYHRATSPNIDRIAAQGVRFENCHASDVPCLPSRTSLFGGRFGIHSGVIDHGGIAAEPMIEGPGRHFASRLGQTSWMRCLRNAGYHTATISPFGERHSAWHWYANFNEIHNTGRAGMENADEVSPVLNDWLSRNAERDHWFLHVNLWDPHTPYRAPEAFGNPFQDSPLPAWYTEEVRQQHWNGCGPHSAQEVRGWDAPGPVSPDWPRQPLTIHNMDAARMMFDGYDCGVRYADEAVGRALNVLAERGVLDDTAIIISADHGENLGELNIYGDHQTADQITTHVPLIIRWPGVTDRHPGFSDPSLIYANDMAATVIELAGGTVPDCWDGASFASALPRGAVGGRDYLVVSQGAWSCQRAVRFRRDLGGRMSSFICIRTYHDGYHGFPSLMLFDTAADPHEQHNLATEEPGLAAYAMMLLDAWTGEMMSTATHGQDPMWTVVNAGGAYHTRGQLPRYLKRLHSTGRSHWANRLAAQHPRECGT